MSLEISILRWLKACYCHMTWVITIQQPAAEGYLGTRVLTHMTIVIPLSSHYHPMTIPLSSHYHPIIQYYPMIFQSNLDYPGLIVGLFS